MVSLIVMLNMFLGNKMTGKRKSKKRGREGREREKMEVEERKREKMAGVFKTEKFVFKKKKPHVENIL